MTLPVSGAISFADVNLEIYGTASTAAVSLNDSVVRNIFKIASGAIDMNSGKGKAYTIAGNSGVLTGGSSFTLPRTSGLSINVLAIAGGGGGGQSSYAGGGGAGGCGEQEAVREPAERFGPAERPAVLSPWRAGAAAGKHRGFGCTCTDQRLRVGSKDGNRARRQRR